MINKPSIANNVLVLDLLNMFLTGLRPSTQRSYLHAFKKIFEIPGISNVFTKEMTLDQFLKLNTSSLLDLIRSKIIGSESTKQARCAAFISFTRFIARHTGNIKHIAIPNHGKNPTFQRIRDKSVAIAMTSPQCFSFLRELKIISYRDWLIAKCILQGAKRVSEVTEAKIDQIDWDKNRITFNQKKSSIREKKTVITYPQDFMDDLKEYVNERKMGTIFITRTGEPISQPHLYRSFAHAGVLADIPFRVHPHALRATAVTLLMKMGYHSDQIINVSGHATSKEVLYYDKTPLENNISAQVRLI